MVSEFQVSKLISGRRGRRRRLVRAPNEDEIKEGRGQPQAEEEGVHHPLDDVLLRHWKIAQRRKLQERQSGEQHVDRHLRRHNVRSGDAVEVERRSDRTSARTTFRRSRRVRIPERSPDPRLCLHEDPPALRPQVHRAGRELRADPTA